MSKYIDAEKLITEIEVLKRKKGFLPLGNAEITEAYMARGVQFTCDDIVNIITSLQQKQPEVDLEKEIQDYIKECLDVKFPTTDIEQIKKDVAYTARHFYELGLNERKEE